MANERCHDVRVRFVPLLRGEASPVERAEAFRHLAECSGCASEFEAETALTLRLRTETARYIAPPDVRAAVEQLVHRRRAGRRASWGERVQTLFRRPLVAAAAGALASLLLALPVSQVLLRGPASNALESLVAEAASGHQRVALQRELLGRQEADVERVLADLQERFGLPVRKAFRGDREVLLLAAQPTFVAGRAGVTFVYAEGPDRILTLTLLPGREIQIPKERATQIEAYRPFVARRDSVGVVAWKQADVAYALTASGSAEDLPRLFLKVRKAAF